MDPPRKKNKKSSWQGINRLQPNQSSYAFVGQLLELPLTATLSIHGINHLDTPDSDPVSRLGAVSAPVSRCITPIVSEHATDGKLSVSLQFCLFICSCVCLFVVVFVGL